MDKARRIKDLTMYATFSAGQGYSGMAEQFGIGLDGLIDTSLVRFNDTPASNISAEGHKLIAKPFRLSDVAFGIGFPLSFDSMRLHRYKVGYTMFETDKLPNGVNDWAGKTGDGARAINENLDLLVVPCKQNIDVFRDAGVTVPIEVVHNPLDPMYKPLDRTKRPDGHKFTFLIMGTLTIRKNSGAVISAFIDLFKDIPDARLIVKTQSGTHGHMTFDKSACGDIEIIDDLYTKEQMLALMQEADCFVFPSHGEGFGLPPLEAAATGLPTIIANHTGMAEYADPRYFYVINDWEKSAAMKYPKKWGNVGNWYDPDFTELKLRMKQVYENQAEAAERGKTASAWVLENFNRTKIAGDLLTAIEKHYKAV